MGSFLGVPVMVAGEPFGNLYLTEKHGGGEFTAADERALVGLAEFAGSRSTMRGATAVWKRIATSSSRPLMRSA